MTDEKDRGTVSFEVEVSEALVDLIRQEHGENVDIEEWITGAIELRLRQLLWNDEATITADVPEELAEQAELLAEHSRVQHGHSGIRGSREDWLHDITHVDFQFPDETEE